MGEDEALDTELMRTGSGGAGTNEIQAIFGGKAFPNPKPVLLIKQLVQQSTGSGDLVLDFFAGSATTAQAVMELNAEDGGNRRFIMVSSTEATAADPAKNLCRDVTAERVRLLNASEDPRYAGLDAPFAYLRARSLAHEDFDHEIRADDVWPALQAIHRLPMTAPDPDAAWHLHETAETVLVFVDHFDAAAIDLIRARAQARANLFVYAWAPGQIVNALCDAAVQVAGVRETLLRFAAQ